VSRLQVLKEGEVQVSVPHINSTISQGRGSGWVREAQSPPLGQGLHAG
jgi:hypothetical protein